MDYSNGKIYKILNTITDDIYVGSTTQSLSKRFSWHKACIMKNGKCDYTIYKKMREYGLDNFYIELIENWPCSCKDELHAREGKWIREMGTLNSRVAGRDKNQYYNDNKERLAEQGKTRYENKKDEILERNKQYREANKDKVMEKKREYYENNKEQIQQYKAEWHQKNKEHLCEKAKQWHNEHREYALEQKRQHYAENKEDILRKQKEYTQRTKELRQTIIKCECGFECQKQSMRHHLKSKRHEELIKQKAEENPQDI